MKIAMAVDAPIRLKDNFAPLFCFRRFFVAIGWRARECVSPARVHAASLWQWGEYCQGVLW